MCCSLQAIRIIVLLLWEQICHHVHLYVPHMHHTQVQVLLHKGEQRGSDYTQRNPLGRVPLLEITDTQGQAFR